MMEGMLPEYGGLGTVRQPTGGGIATAAPSNAYPGSDGVFVLIAANSEPLFAKLMTLMGRPDLIGAQRFASNQKRVENSLELDELIRTWTRRHEASTLVRLLTDADIPNCRVFTAADIAADPQYRERGMVCEVQDKTFDRPVLHPGVVPRFGEQPTPIRWPGPALGEHNREVLQGMLRISDEEMAQLRAEGAI
jgi:crotonobetainyl-CoA:carnitine CoA-transferase CaiB-like acyl-CoA transferase